MVQFDRNRQFKPDTTNQQILNAIRSVASNEYQQRIPQATKSNIRETLQNLLDNRPYWNEFVSALVNRIGMEIYKSTVWNNPLAGFKIGKLEFGDTIEEVMVGLLEAHVYDPSREYLEKDIFGTERPEVQSSFHKVNRRNFYKITVNEPLLQQAFVTSNGLSNFVMKLMESPTTSANYDEFLLTTGLIADYHANGGFFNVNVPDLSADSVSDADAKQALKRMREMGSKLPFLSRHYNASGMYTFANQDDLVLLITPEANATIDVDALAGAFNIDKADMPGRTVVIPKEYFGIPGAQALMTTRDFFVIADQEMRTESQWNPVSLQNNYFLHHWQVISYSRFTPAVLFSTDESTVIEAETIDVTGLSTPATVDHDFTPVDEVARGQSYGAESFATTDPEGVGADNVVWSVEGNESERTYITQTGTLFVAADEPATELTVVASVGYVGETTAPVDPVSTTVTVTGDILRLWPNPAVVDDAPEDPEV